MNKTKHHDEQYISLIKDVLENGRIRNDRTGTGTIGVFGREMRFDLSDGTIPLLTTKKMHIPSIIHELLWYISGSSNIKYLQENGVRIWNEWADENGDLGPVYGFQWRNCPKNKGTNVKVDQLQDCIDKIRNTPYDRRIIVNSWNVSQLEEMRLPPCHFVFQFHAQPYSEEEKRGQKFKGELSLKLTQRSADVGLGVPFNISQYAILLRLIAHVTGYRAKDFIWSGGDVHIYKDHIEALKEQCERKSFPSPTLLLGNHFGECEIDDFEYEDIGIIDYESHPTIKMKVSV